MMLNKRANYFDHNWIFHALTGMSIDSRKMGLKIWFTNNVLADGAAESTPNTSSTYCNMATYLHE